MIVFIRLALGGWNLLDNSSGRNHRTEVLAVNVIKDLLIVEIIQIDVCGNDLVEIHFGFFKIIEQIAHSLPDLMGRGGSVNTAMRPGDESALSGTIQSVTGKNTGAGGGARHHIFRAHSFALLKVAHGYACVFNVSASGKAGYD